MAKKTNLISTTSIMLIIISICVIGAASFYQSLNSTKMTSSEIGKLTDLWIKNVTEKNDPETIADMFCSDGNLVGTVSQKKRQGDDIKKYFDYFAKLPEIKVVDKKYNINEVEPTVYVNTAFITWRWKGLEKPIVARMTFIFRNKCIFQLHSSALPEMNKDLKKISGSA
jgi:hypothetical protein